MNKMEEFIATIERLNPDVVGITESWTSDRVLDSELDIPGYDVIDVTDLAEWKEGVICYVSENFTQLNTTQSPHSLSRCGAESLMAGQGFAGWSMLSHTN